MLPLRKGKNHVSRILRELIEHRPRARGTGISAALETAGRVMKHKGIVIVVSDFIDEQYEISLRRLARRHDVVAIQVSDRLEAGLPRAGLLRVVDPESGTEHVIDPASYSFQKWLDGFHQRHRTDTDSAWQSGRVDSLRIDTVQDPSEALVKFFTARARRRR